MSTPQQPPAGWYPDPETPGVLRYWDGAVWTVHTSAPTPVALNSAGTSALDAPRTSPGVDTNTVWIWLIVLLPLVSALGALLVPWRSFFNLEYLVFEMGASPTAPIDAILSSGPLGVFLSPTYWALMLVGWAIYGFSVWFAYRDRQELLARGIDRPFPWPWMFLSIVYPIGRAVVSIRRTGKGWEPVWGLIGVQVVGLVVAAVISAQITQAAFDMLAVLSWYAN